MLQDYCSAFAQAASDTIAMVCGKTLDIGEQYQHSRSEINNSVAVYLGLIGEVDGYILLRLTDVNAKHVAGMMMGMEVTEFDDMALSALSELGNMIVGSASTKLASVGVLTDITTPTLMYGTVRIKQADITPISIPLTCDDIRVVIDVAIRAGES